MFTSTKKILPQRGLLAVIAAINFAAFLHPSIAQPPTAQYSGDVRAADDVPPALLKTRRARLLATMSGRSFAVFMAADPRNRQNDVDYEYRQSSDLLYLAGTPEPQSALLLIPDGIVIDSTDGVKHTELLFMRPREMNKELWTGVMVGVEGAESLLGIRTLPIARFRDILVRLAHERDTLFITALPTASVVEPLSGETISLDVETKKRLAPLNPKLIVRSQRKILNTLREVKDSVELRLLKKAIDISVAGHQAVMRSVRDTMFEYEAEAIMEGEFKRLAAEDVGYPSILGSGTNACILHYTSNRRQMHTGELLLMDCGAEYHGYTADVTRTIPINGTFTQEQRALYNIVFDAQNASIAMCRTGTDWRTPHSRAVEVIRRGLYKLGIITDTLDNQYRWYFPHGSSHCIGLDVHDSQSNTTLQPNMVLTVEPGIYIPAGSPCDKKWWGIGIRIEDDVLITNNAAVILSEAAPRSVEAIETFMYKARTAAASAHTKSSHIFHTSTKARSQRK
jgi:Xaa-Pro aminopeptidase